MKPAGIIKSHVRLMQMLNNRFSKTPENEDRWSQFNQPSTSAFDTTFKDAIIKDCSIEVENHNGKTATQDFPEINPNKTTEDKVALASETNAANNYDPIEAPDEYSVAYESFIAGAKWALNKIN